MQTLESFKKEYEKSIFISYDRNSLKDFLLVAVLTKMLDEARIQVQTAEHESLIGYKYDEIPQKIISTTDTTIAIISESSLHAKYNNQESVQSLMYEFVNQRPYLAILIDDTLKKHSFPHEVFEIIDQELGVVETERAKMARKNYPTTIHDSARKVLENQKKYLETVLLYIQGIDCFDFTSPDKLRINLPKLIARIKGK